MKLSQLELARIVSAFRNMQSPDAHAQLLAIVAGIMLDWPSTLREAWIQLLRQQVKPKPHDMAG